MLFNSMGYEKNADLWPPQQQPQPQPTGLQQSQVAKKSTNQNQALSQQSELQTMSNNNSNMSPNAIYGALLQYHLQHQQMLNNQEYFMQHQSQQNQQQVLMNDLMLKGNGMNKNNMQHYQLMQRAAQVAAQQLAAKSSANSKTMLNNDKPKHGLNSPALSTSSSSSSSSTSSHSSSSNFMGTEYSKDERKGLKRASNEEPLNKRPYLKFSMDAILGNDESQSKKMCLGKIQIHYFRRDFKFDLNLINFFRFIRLSG